MRTRKRQLKQKRVKKRNYTLYIALSVLSLIILAYAWTGLANLVGRAIYDTGSGISVIAIEEGADADVIIAASYFAKQESINNAVLLSELTGVEENVLILKNIGGDTATISQSGKNIVIEGDVVLGLDAFQNIIYGQDTAYGGGYDKASVVNVASDGSITIVEEADTDFVEEEIPVNNCVDSDGGDNPDVYGTLSGKDVWGNVIDQTDQCGSGTATINDVFEKVCTETSHTYTQHQCENGCENGACVTPPVNNCVDSDGGDNPDVYGTLSGTDVWGNVIDQPDQCGSGTATINEVFEKVCTETSHTYTQHQCENGCENGACVTPPVNNCVDSDGGDNPDVYGTLSGTDVWGNVIDQPDQCGSGTATINEVFEKVCTETSHTYTQHQCENGCENGACVEATEQQVCGNNVVDENEGCDDGNTNNGDGCTDDCVIEVDKGCWETDTGVEGTYTGYYYDYYGNDYSYDYSYDNYCYYYNWNGIYYYYDYYCYENTYDGRWYATATAKECPSGCEDGTGCVDVETFEPYCEDPDGADEFTFSKTTAVNKFGEETVIEDACYSYTDDYHYVIEGYCYNEDTAYTQYIYCDGVCENGVCIKGTEPTCEDSDNTNIYAPQESSFELGEVTGINKAGEMYTKVDECYDSYGYEYIIEQYCSDNDVPYTTYVYCNGGCENGVCIEPEWEQSCEDSDETDDNAGKDIYTAGTVAGLDYYGREFEYPDYCYYNSYYGINYVVDYYCAESASYGPYATTYYDACPEGCTDGACNSGDVTVEPTCTDAGSAVSGIDQHGNEYAYADYCNGAEYLIDYSCSSGSDGAPYSATETACNCIDSMCHKASITVADFVSKRNPIIVIGASAATEDNIAAIDLAGKYGWDVVTDATISNFESGDYVAVGGPYANSASKTAFGGQIWDYGPGEALFLVREYEEGGATLVISGSEAIDTRNAIKLLIKSPPNADYILITVT